MTREARSRRVGDIDPPRRRKEGKNIVVSMSIFFTLNRTMTHIVKSKINQARHMYFSGLSIPDIAETLELPTDVLSEYAFGNDRMGLDPDCWYKQRSQLKGNEYVHYVKAKTHILDIAEAALNKKVHDSALDLAANPDALSLDDMEKASRIAERLNRISRLEKGEATERVELGNGFTLRDIVNGNAIEAEYTVDSADGDSSGSSSSSGPTPNTPSLPTSPPSDTSEPESHPPLPLSTP